MSVVWPNSQRSMVPGASPTPPTPVHWERRMGTSEHPEKTRTKQKYFIVLKFGVKISKSAVFKRHFLSFAFSQFKLIELFNYFLISLFNSIFVHVLPYIQTKDTDLTHLIQCKCIPDNHFSVLDNRKWGT